MALLAPMPQVVIPQADLVVYGQQWVNSGNRLDRVSSGRLTRVIDNAVGTALAAMLGGIPIVTPNANALTPAASDVVEVGPVRVIGGVRPQNFDVGYRPDGIRFAFDSKTLNDTSSVGKNWQNMVNDLATEATTVHTRFPQAVVAFMVVIPTPCLTGLTQRSMIETLERLSRRTGIDQPHHLAEAISLVLWDPTTGTIAPNIPHPTSQIRIERFSELVEAAYVERYKGLPPHAA